MGRTETTLKREHSIPKAFWYRSGLGGGHKRLSSSKNTLTDTQDISGMNDT